MIDDYKKSNTRKEMILDYENKIQQYYTNIKKNEEIITQYFDETNFNKFEKIDNIEKIEDENERLLDGHNEIQYLDKEPTKFARHMSKIL